MDFKDVRKVLSLLIVFLWACSATIPPQPEPLPPVATPSLAPITPEPRFTPVFDEENVDYPPITGQVVDVDGNPLAGARIDSDTGSVLSAADGSFSLPGVGTPQWVRASLEGYIARTRAAGPDQPTIFRLSPDDGRTVVLQFAGDVMFGRRFFDPNEDGDTSDGLLPVQPSVSDHSKLLASIQPLIADADLTIVDFDSALSDQPYWLPGGDRPVEFHSTKDYVFSSHPSAIQALKQAGIDILDLGNDHVYDLLENGLIKTLSVLQENNLAYFGAGKNEASAWEPVIVNVGGQDIAFIGCTTVSRPEPASSSDLSYVAQDEIPKGGAAWCGESKLYQSVSAASQRAELVVVMIHGGNEYDRTPTKRVEKYVSISREAGASLILNHRPHVVGGFTWNAPVLTAWSLGNFIFDQTVWPTFESYVLTVYIRDNEIVRAFTEPIIIDKYLPHGLTGEMAEYVSRGAAGRMPGRFVMEAGGMELDLTRQAESRTTIQTLRGDPSTGTIFPIPEEQWVSAVNGAGKLRLGRDLLWVGSFEPEMVHNEYEGPLLWPLRDSQLYGPEFAYQGAGGIRLVRSKSNQTDSVATHSNRILVAEHTRLTVSGMARPAPGALTALQISWYSAMSGASSQRLDEILPLEPTGEWQPFRLDVQVPAGIIAMGVIIKLLPPQNSTTTLDLDDLRVIEWAEPQAPFSQLYTHILVTGEANVSFQEDFFRLSP